MALQRQYEEKEFYTEDDYFAFEQSAFGRWEYVGGEIRAMAGGTDDHNTVVNNVGRALGNAMVPRGCRVYTSDMKVRTGNGINTFPDVSVVCGLRRYHKGRTDVITNPLLIVEVLSPSTEGYDRGEKFDHYRTIPTLADYLLVSVDEPRVFHFSLKNDHWEFRETTGLENNVYLPSVETSLALSDVYALIEFEGKEARMNIGVVKEIKNNENRVAVVPSGVETLTKAGHTVFVETGAGVGTSLPDDAYVAAGATIVQTAAEVWERAETVCKVKEPQPDEIAHMRPDQTLFTYFHFAASRALSEAVQKCGSTCIAYETVEAPDRTLPLLTPMSEIAGKMAMQEAAKYLEKPQGGRGILLGGIPGVPAAHVVILGGGVVGINAAKVAAGMGATVTMMDVNLERLRYLDDVLPANVTTYFSNALHIREILPTADVVIGAVLIKGARAPILVSQADLKRMKPGAVIVDVAVDQGGCIETMHPTTHAVPVFTVDDVIHYGVANIPGAVPATSTYGLTNATFPYLLALANKGVKQALRDDPSLAKGLNASGGKFFLTEISDLFGLPVSTLDEWLA